MCKELLFCGGIEFVIAAGIVKARAICGDETFAFAMPIADFRATMAGGQGTLDAFDAEHAVVPIKRRRR